jgi:hypothetical protein
MPNDSWLKKWYWTIFFGIFRAGEGRKKEKTLRWKEQIITSKLILKLLKIRTFEFHSIRPA